MQRGVNHFPTLFSGEERSGGADIYIYIYEEVGEDVAHKHMLWVGKGVFDRSIAGLRKLNAAGYGSSDSGLNLDLVYNPTGGFLSPDQSQLEVKYKEELDEQFGICFNNLFTINNMPIKRFADFLHRRGELEEYMELLVRNFNPSTING